MMLRDHLDKEHVSYILNGTDLESAMTGANVLTYMYNQQNIIYHKQWTDHRISSGQLYERTD